MRTAVRALVLGAGLAVCWMGSARAQAGTVDEVLRGINQMLQESSYYDHGGKHTVSQVSLRRGGTLVIHVTKTDQNGEVTNIYESSLRTINLEHIQAHHRGDHTVLMIGCQGDVTTKLKNVQRSGNVTEWDLPVRGSMVLEFRSGDTLAKNIIDSIKQLIGLAREDPRYAA